MSATSFSVLSQRTTRITGCGGTIDHIKSRGYRIPVHAIVNTVFAILRLCDFVA
jgi:hypothetical protein